MAQGQAAGTAAALAVARRCTTREVKIAELQDALTAQGVEIGRTLADPDAALLERIGTLPLEEADVKEDYESLAKSETAWIR
jgi:hypothetical protein